jgi:hypothetical protein
MDNNFEKTDQSCNNIFLIDERLCLSNSIDLINSNFLNLSAAIDQLIPYANQFNALYTSFAANSATWNLGASNTSKGKNNYNSFYSTINTLSASWNKPFSVIYPYINLLNTWNSNTIQYQNIVKNWLTVNYKPLDFVDNQIVYVNVNLYKIDTFNYSFSNSFYESCEVQAPSTQVCCTGAGGERYGGQAGWLSRFIRIVPSTADNSCALLLPHAGCNINFNWKGKGKRCVNPWAECERRVVNNCATGNCTSYNKKTLSVSGTTPNYTDRYTAKCILLKFRKLNNNEWGLIS